MAELDDGTAGAADAARADADRERVAAANKAARDRSMIAHGRRIGGVPGAIVAGAMIAIRDIYEGPSATTAPSSSTHHRTRTTSTAMASGFR